MPHYICQLGHWLEFDTIEELSDHVRKNHPKANDASILFKSKT